MNEQIINSLDEHRGKYAWITIEIGAPILVLVDTIDYTFNTVKLINENGNAALKELHKLGNFTVDREREIINNPDNFFVIPVHQIGKIESHKED